MPNLYQMYLQADRLNKMLEARGVTPYQIVLHPKLGRDGRLFYGDGEHEIAVEINLFSGDSTKEMLDIYKTLPEATLVTNDVGWLKVIGRSSTGVVWSLQSMTTRQTDAEAGVITLDDVYPECREGL